jgi:hypothetical protein
MKRAAIGVRMHSGWGALVVVSNGVGTMEIIDRRRVAITLGPPWTKDQKTAALAALVVLANKQR